MGREEPNALTPQSPWSLSARIWLSGEAWSFLRQAPTLTLSLVLARMAPGTHSKSALHCVPLPPKAGVGFPPFLVGLPHPLLAHFQISPTNKTVFTGLVTTLIQEMNSFQKPWCSSLHMVSGLFSKPHGLTVRILEKKEIC